MIHPTKLYEFQELLKGLFLCQSRKTFNIHILLAIAQKLFTVMENKMKI